MEAPAAAAREQMRGADAVTAAARDDLGGEHLVDEACPRAACSVCSFSFFFVFPITTMNLFGDLFQGECDEYFWNIFAPLASL